MAVENDVGFLMILRDYWGIIASAVTGLAGVVVGRERTRYQVESVSDRLGAFEQRLKSVEDQGNQQALHMASMKAELGMLPEMRQDIKDVLMAISGRK